MLVALGACGAGGCTGEQGPPGANGAGGGAAQYCSVANNGDGTKTISCPDGTTATVRDGQAGKSCTLTDNGDGTKTISCDGTSFTVSDGQAGKGCTVTENADGSRTVSCADGTSFTVSDGEPGTSVATVAIHLVDADTGADIQGADLVATPGELPAATDASGRATFANLPFGVYRFQAFAPGLRVSGNAVVAGPEQSAETEPLSLVAGATATLEFKLRRLELGTVNLVSLHTGGHASFGQANCVACHNDRRSEQSTEGSKAPWHALTVHGSAACNTCHQTVDLVGQSGATLRKQVNVGVCKGCHTSYPNSF